MICYSEFYIISATLCWGRIGNNIIWWKWKYYRCYIFILFSWLSSNYVCVMAWSNQFIFTQFISDSCLIQLTWHYSAPMLTTITDKKFWTVNTRVYYIYIPWLSLISSFTSSVNIFVGHKWEQHRTTQKTQEEESGCGYWWR